MIRLGVIGFGYWGPNIVRNFNGVEGSEVTMICDMTPNAFKRAGNAFPHIRVTNNCDDVFNSPDIDAVAVITPVSTHYELSKRTLESGKHLFVEKPFTASVSQAEELIEIAARKNLVIMVDHTFIFTGAVRYIKQLIEREALGRIFYYDSTRVNLGLFQRDVNVIWDLAPHDFAIVDFLFEEKPVAVMACGKSHMGLLEDMAYVTVLFESNMIAHFDVNWLSPVKVRNTLIGGEKKMLMWNDVESDEKIKIYDKGVEILNKEAEYQLLVNYRMGDMHSPRLEQGEALLREAAEFVACIREKRAPVNDGHAGLRIVKLLVACDESLKRNGAEVKI